MGPGSRQHRLRMGADGRARLSHQAPARNRLQRKPPLTLPASQRALMRNSLQASDMINAADTAATTPAAAAAAFSSCSRMLLQITSGDSIGKTHERKNYELQYRNNPRRHRDSLRPAHLRYWRATRAGGSHPARAGDHFRGKRIPPGLVQSTVENGGNAKEKFRYLRSLPSVDPGR